MGAVGVRQAYRFDADRGARQFRPHAIVPLQTAKGDQLASGFLLILDERFVTHVVELKRQYPLPMRQQLFVLSAIRSNVLQGARKGQLGPILKVASQGNIKGLTPTMNNAGAGK